MKVKCIHIISSQGAEGLEIGGVYHVTHMYEHGSVDIIDGDGEVNMLFGGEYEVVEE